MRTTSITKPLEVTRKWFVVDAADQNLGRLSSQVAHILRGKHKPIFAPNVDAGDYVIVVNADKVKVTGNKLDQKYYVRHSGYLGRKKEIRMREMFKKNPEFVLTHAVKGMLPKNNLGRKMLTKFHVYAGPDHKHEAQKPEALVLAK
ncbi:MAG: 50S ribosomal protein L13 [Defluviitaleaceae bacterium]|nr:50S ribosomal protein L13 [Defluviitaleaceae bacterium]MCL2203776.1 50S ribosomal protein L13 [Defluviitaleaceae bacterium]MCL2239245.1 50S ribosomal protein L13 [Defluviitaleaceae bacterium]